MFCITLTSIASNTSKAEGGNDWYKPGYFKTQYAGNIGFMSIGLGYEWWKGIAQTDMLYGYIPESHGNATIHTFTLKNTFRLYNFYLIDKYNISPILGFSLSFEPGENSYMRVPSRYPEGYYVSTSFYACINAGLKSRFQFKEENKFSAMDVYIEANTVADYAYYRLTSKEDENAKIFTMAVGFNFFF